MVMYELFNTQTEEVEATEFMTSQEAKTRNDYLRSYGESQRWIPKSNDDANDDE
jgi:hypothetical protein